MDYKTIRNIAIAGAIGLASIVGYNSIKSENSNTAYAFFGRDSPNKYSFNNFGKSINSGSGGLADFEAADFDGDGDIDIAVNYGGTICIYENEIPQKNKLE